MLYREEDYRLVLEGDGELRPWIGPAVRGLLGLRLKEAVCRFTPAEQPGFWKHCRGCPHMAGCAYGRTLEPDTPPGRSVPPGRADAARPVALAPYYPTPVRAVAGLEIPFRAVAVGEHAVTDLPRVTDALARAGQTHGLGLGGCRFRLTPAGPPRTGVLAAADLPKRPYDLPGRYPRVGVGLTAPLFLTTGSGKDRESVAVPTFGRLVRAAVRTLGDLFRLYGEELAPDADALFAAADRVATVEHCYEPFAQMRRSARHATEFTAEGAVGGGVYADVPAGLLPWLVWGGRLHVGTHRVAGAGGWRVILD